MVKTDTKTDDRGISYLQVGGGTPDLVFIHGLFGAGRNWLSYLKWVHREHSLTAAALDQRGHGASVHFDGTGTMDVLIDDLVHFLRQHVQEKAGVVGHSLGGKVLIGAAAKMGDEIGPVMIVDTGTQPISEGRIEPIKWLKEIPVPVDGRREGREILSKYTDEKGLIDFLLTNLQRGDEGWTWRIDLEGLEEVVGDLSRLDYTRDWEKIAALVTLVRGGNSSHLTEEDAQKMVAQREGKETQCEVIDGAGHWCHVDNPEAFRQVLARFLVSVG